MIRAVGYGVSWAANGTFDVTVEYQDTSNKNTVVEVRVHNVASVEELEKVAAETITTLAPVLRLAAFQRSVIGSVLAQDEPTPGDVVAQPAESARPQQEAGED